MRGDKINVRAIATRCRMPPESSPGYFAASRATSRPTFAIHSRARARRSRDRHAAALEPEGHVVLDGAVVEGSVVLKDHAAVRARTRDRLAADEHGALGGRVLGAQPGDQPQHRRFSAPGRSQNRDELAFVRQVGHRERHVADDGEVAEPLRDVVEIDDVGGLTRARPRARSRSVLDDAVGKQAALEPEQHAIDAVREQADDDEDQDDVLRQPASLARHQQVAQAVLRVDQLGEHDVAEGEAEEMPEAVVNVRNRERDEHLP